MNVLSRGCSCSSNLLVRVTHCSIFTVHYLETIRSLKAYIADVLRVSGGIVTDHCPVHLNSVNIIKALLAK